VKGITLLATVAFLVGFTYEKNKLKTVRDINIQFVGENTLFMNYQMVNNMLIQNEETVKNKPKTVIDLHLLEANILSHPMVEDASVFLTVDGLLKAKVKQRTPIARVIAGSKSYYIDKQAKTMPLSVNHSARVLLVSGSITEADNEEIYVLATAILNDDFLKKQIIGIQKTTKNEYNLSTRIGEQKIELGRIEDLPLKFENLKMFYAKTMTDQTIDNYTTINLKYNNQVVCTKK
jgi:cell division protein FtsQ